MMVYIHTRLQFLMTFGLLKQIAIRALLTNAIQQQDIDALYNNESATVHDLTNDYIVQVDRPNPLTFAILALKMKFTHQQRMLLAKSMLHLQNSSSRRAYQTIWDMVSYVGPMQGMMREGVI